MNGDAATAVAAGMSLVGLPYREPGSWPYTKTRPSAVDCSGLCAWAWFQAGVHLEHFTGAMWAGTRKRPLAAAQPGDLVFFGIAPVPHHVGLYVGGGQMVEAPGYNNEPVQVSSVTRYHDLIRSVGIPPGSKAGAVNTGSGTSSNEQTIYQFLRTQLGFDTQGAAGALGNLQVESNFNPAASNPNEGAIGIAQWEGPRRVALDAYAKKTGGSETSLVTQLGFLAQELRGRSGVLAGGRSATDAGAYARDWRSNFEGAAPGSEPARVQNAQTIYQQIATGKPLTGGGTSSAGAAAFTGGGTGSGAAGFSLSSLDPSSWVKSIEGWGLKLAFAMGGVTLVLLGAYATVRETGN